MSFGAKRTIAGLYYIGKKLFIINNACNIKLHRNVDNKYNNKHKRCVVKALKRAFTTLVGQEIYIHIICGHEYVSHCLSLNRFSHISEIRNAKDKG